jgi:hypothetical protein
MQTGRMSRVHGLNKQQVEDADILRVFERQEKNYREVLENHAVLARLPAIFQGFRAMWDGLEESGLLGTRLACLLNVRVASLIGCGL